jgi:hypothetical protein
MRKLTKDDFIRKSNLKHNNRYDYSISNYINSTIKVDIVCKEQQHFKSINYFGGQKAFDSQKERDIKKDEYCRKNNIHLIRIPYNKIIENELSLHFNLIYT